jgi:excisionase family DNA binding protein
VAKQAHSAAPGIDNPLRLTKRLFSLAEAAVYLGRSVWAVRELVWKGALPMVKIGRRVHLDISDLDEFVNKNKMIYGR